MKLATFIADPERRPTVGIVDSARRTVLDVGRALELMARATTVPHGTMLDVIDHWVDLKSLFETAAAAAGEQSLATANHSLDDVTLLAPLEPRQMRDCMAFEQHLLNAYAQAEKRSGTKRTIPAVWYKQPIYYKTNRFAVAGTGADVHWPAYSKWIDYELEFAAIIGRRGRDLTTDNAMDHIFGYTVFNDFSARDAQLAEMAAQLGPAKGKDFDGGNVLGPWIVTADEIGDPHTLTMTARVNGERWGGGNSRDMHHKWPAILAHISAAETIYPGEVIGSGTVGTGCGLELGRKLSHGDVVELEVERIGIICNRVVVG